MFVVLDDATVVHLNKIGKGVGIQDERHYAVTRARREKLPP